MTSGLPCMCCRKPIPEGKAQLFATVFCCPDCYTVAERTYERAESELRYLLVVMKDVIRVGLLEGRLQFQSQPQGEVPKAALLKELLDLAQSKPTWGLQTPLTPTPPVLPVADEERSPTSTLEG